MAIVFGNKPVQAGTLILFTIWQAALVKGYLALRKRDNKASTFYAAVFLSILPLILVKVIPFVQPMSTVGFLGISYLTFKAVQMTMEIRDGQIKEITVFNFLRFLLFFSNDYVRAH
ncbi:hypothetical protein GCM10020331_072090 [Ectobacillus funiculus]